MSFAQFVLAGMVGLAFLRSPYFTMFIGDRRAPLVVQVGLN